MEDWNSLDLYAILNLDKSNCTEQDIKLSFKRLSLLYHPDKNPNNDDSIIFQKIHTAYTILSDSRLKSIYDKQGMNGIQDEWQIVPSSSSRSSPSHSFLSSQDVINNGKYEMGLNMSTWWDDLAPLQLEWYDYIPSIRYLSLIQSFNKYWTPQLFTFVSLGSIKGMNVLSLGLKHSSNLYNLDTNSPSSSPSNSNEENVDRVFNKRNESKKSNQNHYFHRIISLLSKEINLTFGSFNQLGAGLHFLIFQKCRLFLFSGLRLFGGSLAITNPSLNIDYPWNDDLIVTGSAGLFTNTITIVKNWETITGSIKIGMNLYDQSPIFSTRLEFKLSDSWSLKWKFNNSSGDHGGEIPLFSSSSSPSNSASASTSNVNYSSRGDGNIVSNGIMSFGLVTTFIINKEKGKNGMEMGNGIPCKASMNVEFSEEIVWLKLGLSLNNHQFTIPILMANEACVDSIGFSMAIPVLLGFIGKKLFYNPLNQYIERRKLEELSRKNREILDKRREEHEMIMDLLAPLYEKRIGKENQDLIIIEGAYGSLNSKINVKIPLQMLMIGNSHLYIAPLVSKSGLLGFYDMSPGESKFLYIKYSFKGAIHEITVNDYQEVILPQKEHQIL